MSDVSSAPGKVYALTKWLKAAVCGVCLLLLALVSWYEWTSYQDTLTKGEVDARLLAGSLAQHAEDTFETVDVLLLTLSDRLQTTTRTPAEIWEIGEGVANQLRRTPRIRSISAYDEMGRTLVSSQLLVPDFDDIALTDDFKYHRDNNAIDALIGLPTRSRGNNDWIIPVSRRMSRADGSFAGILLATIRVNYFSEFYRQFSPDGEKGISLVTRAGILLSRFPLVEQKIGRSYASQPWFPEVLASPGGSMRFESPIDHVERIHGFRSADSFPVAMVVGIDRTTVLGGWLRGCLMSIAGAGSGIMLLAFFGLKLVRHVEVRGISEAALSQMARTDGLTGIANRRAFDEMLVTVCSPGSVTASQVSLLLLDVDHFKRFNDRYGHSAGDECLRVVASTISSALFRPTDRVARYGGEEFAVVLPDTDERSALLVAERIRSSIQELSYLHEDSPTADVVTVSIGCSSRAVSLRGVGGADLVEAADRALYLAKSTGRNNVQTYSKLAPSLVRSPVTGH